MLSAGSASAILVDQAANARVVGSCTCGCPTIDISVDGSKVPMFGPSAIIADADGTCPHGNPVGVILHAREGLLAELEIYSKNGSDVREIPRWENLSIV